ncbi:MAG: hypothetical protein JXB32_07095 [Deltaproteobacteria bacterium]|nr:hypothetical protein [Deltaproteobacteria bacterium]
MRRHSILLAAGLTVIGVLASSCDDDLPPCGPHNCTGCCYQDFCHAGNTDDACLCCATADCGGLSCHP